MLAPVLISQPDPTVFSLKGTVQLDLRSAGLVGIHLLLVNGVVVLLEILRIMEGGWVITSLQKR